MIVLDPSSVTQVVREPREVQKEKQAAAEEVSGVGAFHECHAVGTRPGSWPGSTCVRQ